MKKIIMALLVSGIFCSAAIAQRITTDKVPALVYRAFKTKFPASNQESWSMEDKTSYEVDFFNGNKKQSAVFKEDGTWLETETEITFNQLPRPVNAAFNKQFGGFTVQETLQVETPDKGTLYEMIINKGTEGYEVEFSAKGDLLKKDAAKADD
jgi:hypothetical protein